MKKSFVFWLCLSVCLIAFAKPSIAQQTSEQPKNTQPKTPEAPTSYETSPAFPYGRLNPGAPHETKQFSFMIGEFDCLDEIIDPQNGQWIKFDAIWNAKYFLNGHAIQDQYWNPQFSTSNIRIFDPKDKKWKVTFFKMPGYGSGVWTGRLVGENLVMLQGDENRGSRLTFSAISSDSFYWAGESIIGGTISAFWKSNCKRRR